MRSGGIKRIDEGIHFLELPGGVQFDHVSAVEQIKLEIEKLSLSERGELVRWLHRWHDDDWDRQMRSDAATGKLDELIKEADDAIDTGKLSDLP